MGIRRLMSDILSFATETTLGAPITSDDGANITQSLVIDGPSLSFFVYNKLLTYRGLEAGTGVPRLPTYDEVAQAYMALLTEFAAHGVEIEAIYFDGALPLSKEQTRLDRLDKTRIQLRKYRSQYREVVPPYAAPALPIDYPRALWLRGAAYMRPALLPPPPFMVASIIEILRDSKWQDKVHVVPEEADIACARSAKASGSAILSNDSDIAVYDLGEASLVQIETLEKVRIAVGDARSRIKASCFYPERTASRLGLSSFQYFAYSRSLDSPVSTAIISQSARSVDRLDLHFKDFVDEYALAEAQPMGPLNHLDPRTSEVVVDATSQLHEYMPSMYLPILYEDPERESAWSYGQDIRQLAYSYLFRSHRAVQASAVVNEHYRKGDRISKTKVIVLRDSELNQHASSVLNAFAAQNPTSAFLWYGLALRLVIKQKLEAGKAITWVDIRRMLGLPDNHTSCRWTDFHLHATVQAVLYSLRILHQLLRHTAHLTTKAAAKDPNAEKLRILLESLPKIGELFTDIGGLRSVARDSPAETKSLLEDIKALLGVDEQTLQSTSKAANKSANDPDHDSGEKQPRKRRKMVAANAAKAQSSNMFNLLAGDDTEGDTP